MTTRRALKGILHGFLGTFGSRYSSYQGYWLFGFVVADLDTTEIDLLHPTPNGDPDAPTNILRTLAATKFLDQLAKAGLHPRRVASASLILERLAPATAVVEMREREGFTVQLSVTAAADTGRVFTSRTILFVAPHDPTIERKSASA